MKNTLAFRIVPVLTLVLIASARAERVEIPDAPFPMPPFEVPSFPARDFPIDAYGAKADGSKCTAAIAAAMAACEKAGGGRVVVPRGTWLTGAVRFRSNCNLHLAEGATLAFTDDPADYLPAVPTSWEGVECLNYSPLVYAYGVENVAITGPGTLAPRMGLWRTWFKRPPAHMKATECLYHWCSTNAPLAARDVTAIRGANVRPHLLQFNRAKGILLDGFRIRQSPFWTIHLFHSENAVVRNLDTYAHGHNNDGVDIEMTRNVLVENCRFDQGDDGIVLKAGRNRDAWRLNRPTENVVVRNCEFAFAHTLVGIGSELSGGIRNFWLHDCKIEKSHNLLYVKTNRRRGGFVENVFLENIDTDAVKGAVFGLKTDVLYQWAKFPDYELRYTKVRNIRVKNVHARCADWAFDVTADAHEPARGLHFENVRVDAVRKGFKRFEHAEDVTLENATLGTGVATPWENQIDEVWHRPAAAGDRAREGAGDGLVGDFANPPQARRPWTYWFWTNTLTDRETMSEELADIAKLGFGGLLLTDSRGYWDDEDHVVNPPATIRWGGDEWLDLIAHGVREAAKHNLRISLNVAASGGHLRGDADVGSDNPKFLMCRRYRPGEAFERPAIPHYRDVAVFAVRTAEPAAAGGWRNAGDGYFSMSASSGKRADGEQAIAAVSALEVRELTDAAAGAGLGANWTILRFGAGTMKGQEVDIDVLDRAAVNRHLDRVIGKLVSRVPDLVGRDRTLAYLYNVSWEGAMPTWSATFEKDFAAAEGYALRPFLPALAGFTLEAKGTADLMRDFRHARGVMMRDHLYGAVREWAHRHGMGAFSESGGPWQRNPETFGECDQLGFLAANDFPQGEFWPSENTYRAARGGRANANGRYISKAIASAAHVYDCPYASAEAYTHMHHHWSVDPAFLKPVGDQAFADGINLMVWHTYTTSPKKYGIPGLEYFAGSHINRNVTWHDEFPAMVTYLARCQTLLQRGTSVADIAVLVGDRAYTGWSTEKNGRFRGHVSDEIPLAIPAGYDYDLVNDDALARNPGLLKRYRVVHDARPADRRKGSVDVGRLLPDVADAGAYTWCHRRADGAEIYFLAGEGPAQPVFRATAPAVEIWDAVSGRREPAQTERTSDGRTRVALDLPVGGSAFVMFLGKGTAVAGKSRGDAETVAVAGPWNVSFAFHPGIAAEPPKSVTLPALVDFTTREDLKHFSGRATYRATVTLPAGKPLPATLALGKVPSGLAHVYVNGRDCGTVWCAPWEADVGAALKPGENRIEIRYVNNWANRLIGDCALPEEKRVTKSVLRYWNVPRKNPELKWKTRPTVYSGYSSYDPLQKCGLLGPVVLKSAARPAPAPAAAIPELSIRTAPNGNRYAEGLLRGERLPAPSERRGESVLRAQPESRAQCHSTGPVPARPPLPRVTSLKIGKIYSAGS